MKSILGLSLVIGLVAVSARAEETSTRLTLTLEEHVEFRPSRPTEDPGRNCTEHLQEVNSNGVADAWHPQCEVDGTYAARQVYNHPTNGFIKCVSPGGKDIIQGPEIKACTCPRIRFKETARTRGPNRIVGNFIPACNETTGHYTPRQSHGSTGYSWCVDEAGNDVGERKRGRVEC